MLIYMEILIYTLYIYFLVFLFLMVKPSFLSIPLLFIYCFISTWYTIIVCRNKLLNNTFFKSSVVFIYSFMCTAIYILIHYHKQTLMSKIFIISMPMWYLINVKLIEWIFVCEKHFGLFTPVRIFSYFYQSIIKMIYTTN